MASMQQKKSYDAPTGGLQDRYSPLMINPDEANELENFVVNDRGILDKVKGYQKDGSPFPNSTDSFIRMLINYKRGTTVDKLIMAAQDNGNTNATYKVDYKSTSGDGIYAYIGHTAGTNASFTNASTAVTGVGTTWLSHLKAGDKIKATSHTDAMYTEIASVTNDTNLVLVAGGYLGATTATVAYTARIITNKSFVPRSIVFNNKCIITNGSDAMMTYDNTTLNLITDADAPKPKFIEAHKSRVFTASTSGNPSRLQWSAVNDESAWDATSIEDVYPNDNGNVIGIKSFADSLIVFKNNGNIYQVVGEFGSAVGEPDFIRKIDVPENIGIISERSIVVHTDGIYFLTETGMYRLDPRLYVEKVSYEVDNFLDSVSFALGPSSSKSYAQDTKTEWDTGSHNGTKATADGTLLPYYDQYAITDAKQGSHNCSVFIDSSNIVHVAYVLNSDDTIIKYKKYAVDGTVTTETAIDEAATVGWVSIAASSTGKIGVAWSTGATHRFVERSVAGTWGSAETVYTSAGSARSNSIAYNSSNDPRIAGLNNNSGLANEIIYGIKVGAGAWSTTDPGLGAAAFSAGITQYPTISLVLDGSNNPSLAFSSGIGTSTTSRVIGGGIIRSSSDAGATWGANTGLAGAYALDCKIQLDILAGGNLIVGIQGVNTGTLAPMGLRTFNSSTNTLATVDSDTTAIPNGYQSFNTDQNHFYCQTAATPLEKFVYNGSSTITNGSQTAITTYIMGDRSFHHNGQVCASVIFGSNANEIIVRRLSLYSRYTSQENSDATLTAWGTYEVGDQVNASATVLHEVAIDSTAGPTSYVTITSGSVVSTDAAKYFIKNRITFSLGAFAQPSVGSVVINYTGAGVDAKQPVGISYNTELYMACAKTSDSANAQILFHDLESKWALFTHPVSSMSRYKNKLYAGKATSGDLIILRQTLKFDTAAYTASFISKEDFLDSIDLEKDIFKIYVLYEVKSAGSFTFAYRLDSFKTNGGSTWKSKTVDQTSLGIDEILVGDKAHTIQYRIQNANSDQECSVIGFVVVYGMLNQR